MSEPNSSPVSLPAGSYDYDDLKKGVDKAAKGAAKNYDTAVATALDTATAKDDAGKPAFEPVDPRSTPGYKLVDVENSTLGVTETIQVYDPAKAGDVEETDAIPARQAETRAAAVEAADSAPKE